ncbi:MAG: Uma2 family endonuclease [Kofleriaceae bacterium]|nr:Uma2 family endonuclease [Kofleriaceae bacterium]
MPEPWKRNATYEDLDDIPDTYVGEIIDGDLWAFPRPASGHAVVLAELQHELAPFSRDKGPDGWVILADVEVRFGPHLLVPDLVGWRRSRMPKIPDLTVFELAPDWVCEGMSPSTARLDRGRKREIYAQGRVGHIWFGDPVHHTLEVLALHGPVYHTITVAGGNDRGRFAPFDAVELDVGALWSR